MAKRISIAVCLTLGAAFIVGAGCSSIPDHRTVLSGSNDGGVEPGTDGGETGGTSAGGRGGGTSTGGGSNGGSGTGGQGNGGKGNGGNGGTGNGGVTGSVDGGDGGVTGLPCGSNHCQDRAVGRTTYAACCAGPKGDRCGLDTTVNGGPGCVEPDQAGVLDGVICLEQMSSDGNTTYYGCCRPDGKCGVEFTLYGDAPHFGCVDPRELSLAAGKDCTPAACTAAGKACKNSSECCPGSAGEPVCATFTDAVGSICSDYCTTNRDCASGCCVVLISGRGACAPDASACSTACRKTDETCDVDADCCSPNICSPNSELGPRLCRPKCTTNADCKTGYCVKDSAGRGACSTGDAGLCSDTCHHAKDGSCDDDGPMASGSSCLVGTDCNDCGATTARLGGTSYCFDSCSTHGNGKCEDGGTGSSAASCAFGTDCTDCGKRLGICTDDCYYSANGSCEDGGLGAGYKDCPLGTDCTDCGVRIGGRGQGLCDGTTGRVCVPEGDKSYIADGTCQCADCAWDVVDCKTPASKCDGKTLGACCAPTNPCHIQYDGICACGGWCDWEAPDCGNTFPPPTCDGYTTDGCDLKSPNKAFMGNGKCDCGGACSWEAAECKTQLGNKLCTDTCKYADDGTCDDDDVKCAYGTDCADCGPRVPR